MTAVYGQPHDELWN